MVRRSITVIADEFLSGGPDQLELGHAPVHLNDEQVGRFVLHLYESLLSLRLSDGFTEQLVLAVMTRALSGDASELKAGPRELLQHAR